MPNGEHFEVQIRLCIPCKKPIYIWLSILFDIFRFLLLSIVSKASICSIATDLRSVVFLCVSNTKHHNILSFQAAIIIDVLKFKAASAIAITILLQRENYSFARENETNDENVQCIHMQIYCVFFFSLFRP